MDVLHSDSDSRPCNAPAVSTQGRDAIRIMGNFRIRYSSMTYPLHFHRLPDVVATVSDASDLTANAFQTAPVVLAPTFLRQRAFSLSPEPGLALEFGVFKGSSIRRLALALVSCPRNPYLGNSKILP